MPSRYITAGPPQSGFGVAVGRLVGVAGISVTREADGVIGRSTGLVAVAEFNATGTAVGSFVGKLSAGPRGCVRRLCNCRYPNPPKISITRNTPASRNHQFLLLCAGGGVPGISFELIRNLLVCLQTPDYISFSRRSLALVPYQIISSECIVQAQNRI